MNRREFVKLALSGALGLELDLDKLLWMPGKKKIFLPPVSPVSLYGIPFGINSWLGINRIEALFERDNAFYRAIAKETIPSSSKEIRIPLQFGEKKMK